MCLDPLAVTIDRAGRRLIEGLELWGVSGASSDRFIQLTEGVVPEERVDRRVPAGHAELVSSVPEEVRLRALTETGAADLRVGIARERVSIELQAVPDCQRLGVSWRAAPGERMTGLGARHGTSFDQSGRIVRLGADRRYTGPDCPPEMLDVGGVPQGDYAPAPWLLSNEGYALWLETFGAGAEFSLGSRTGADGAGAPAVGSHVAVSTRTAAGPFRLHVLCDATPAARLRHYCRLTGLPALLPEWGYGHWKSRDVYEHADDVVDDFEGYLRHGLPLDAIVIDSPWETHYNTWRFAPEQFPDPTALIARMRQAGVRTVLWTTPWVNLESGDGQRPPGEDAERRSREAAPNYAPAERAGHFVHAPDGGPQVTRWWMGTGSPIDFTSRTAERWWRGLARGALALGAEGIKADDGDGYYFPPDARFADGRTGAEAAWAYGGLYRESMQRAVDDEHPGAGLVFGRCGWSGQQRHGMLWGGDQLSDFWSLAALVAATLTAAASGFSNWSHDVGGYLGRRLVERCPKELLVRWLQFGCFTPLMQSHGRFEQEAWTYDRETLDLYRDYVLLHERLVPYVRAAAAQASRCGIPIVRPLCLTDPHDPRGWTIADAYGYGPSLWVAPVLEEGARQRRVALPRGDWIDLWTHERVTGGREVTAMAPLARIPVWVRSGAIVVTHPAAHVADGLGDTPESERPLEATLWGTPKLGRTSTRLADGTRLRWHHGEWSVDPRRAVAFAEVAPG